ncbi:MAG: DUF4229 domain-containing protein [Rhodoglobus sp.]|nr:DUF4229 domain-containing protein [Rhodoglobus sp.]
MKPWVLYSLVRVGVFALALAILLLIGIEWWLAAIIAAVVGLCVAYIFFGRLRDAVAHDIVRRRNRPAGDVDSAAEDVG